MSLAAASSSDSRGRRGTYILNNHIILEAIIVALPELRDIIALSCVSRQIQYDVQHVLPLHARMLSFNETPAAADANVLALFERHLKDGKGARPCVTMLQDGGTIVRGRGGVPGTAFTGSWRFLTDLDLSGTNITTMTAKVLIAATCSGNVPGLCVPPKREFKKEFPPRGSFAGEYLLNNQGLRLERLSIAGCRGVQASQLVEFLRNIALAVTSETRKEVCHHLLQGAPGTVSIEPMLTFPQRRQVAAPAAAGNNAMNPLLMGGLGGHHPNNFGGINNHPGVYIPENLQLLGLTEDDVASIPSPMPSTATELEEFGLPCFSLRRLDLEGIHGLDVMKETDAPPVFKTVASLCTVTGLLGLDIDIQFCQGASCAYDIQEDHDGPDFVSGVLEHHRDSYKRPLPHIPHERIIRTPSGRIFRIPRHCIPDVDPLTAYAPQGGNFAANLAQLAATIHGVGHVSFHQAMAMATAHTNLTNHLNPQPQILPPAVPIPAGFIPAFPAHNAHPPFYQPQAQDLRRTCMPSASEKALRRRIAMPNGPRGLCESCGREMWLCKTCNAFWVLYCGSCASKIPPEQA
jgi:hypothetical protein